MRTHPTTDLTEAFSQLRLLALLTLQLCQVDTQNRHRRNITKTSTCGRLELNPYLSLHTKISSKCIKALTLELKLPEEKVKCALQEIGLCEDLVNRIPVAREIKLIINKRDFVKLKGFSAAKDTWPREETGVEVSLKAINRPTIRPSHSTLGHISKGLSLFAKRHLHICVHSNITI